MRGQIFEHFSKYFTIWEITFLLITQSNLNGFKFRKKGHFASVLPQLLSTHLTSSFNIRWVQIWPRTFPLCIGHKTIPTGYLFKELISEICGFYCPELNYRPCSLLYIVKLGVQELLSQGSDLAEMNNVQEHRAITQFINDWRK